MPWPARLSHCPKLLQGLALWLHPLERDSHKGRLYQIREFVVILILWKSSSAL